MDKNHYLCIWISLSCKEMALFLLLLLSDKTFSARKKGSIPFAGVDPFGYFGFAKNQINQCAKIVILADSRSMVR